MNKYGLILIAVAPTAWAGYGGMANIESDDDSPVDLGGIVITALIIGAIVHLWKKYL